MKQTRNAILLCSIGLGITQTAIAQDVSKLYSIDMYTGVTSIFIPIVNYELDNNQFGVSLSYNTKGVPVREFAGVCGSHWDLNVGGGITRIVKGLPDEWFSYGSYILDGTETDPSNAILVKYNRYKGRLVASQETPTERTDPKVYRDPESDEYQVSVGGLSFTFQIGQEGDIFVNTQKRYEVKFLNGDVPYQNPTTPIVHELQDINIAIKDKENGMRYYFSPSDKIVTTIHPYFRSNYPWDFTRNCGSYDMIGISGHDVHVTASWKLDSVISATNEKITYSYKTFVMPLGYTKDKSWTQIKKEGTSSEDIFAGNSNSPYFLEVDRFEMVSSIHLPYGRSINLNYDTVNTRLELQGHNNTGEYKFYPKLSAVVFKEGDNALQYTFDYSYFHTPSTSYPQTETNVYLGDEADRYSLKLMGINVVDGKTSVASPMYSMGYNDIKQRRFGKGLDFYGYYNGGSTLLGETGHSLPDLTGRSSNITSMQYGMLHTIVSGTGSKLELTYGLQKVYPEFSSIIPLSSSSWRGSTIYDQNVLLNGDGLRTERIVLSDINNPNIRDQHNFEYFDGQYYIPGGIFSDPSHYYNRTSDSATQRYIYETMLNPSMMVGGANHGYSVAKETIVNQKNETVSSKEFSFTNFIDEYGAPRIHILGGGQSHIGFPFTQKQYIRTWEMGLPLSVKDYDNNGLLLSEEQYQYTFVLDTLSSLTQKVIESNEALVHLVNYAPDPAYAYYTAGDPCTDVHTYRVIKDPYRPYKGTSLLTQKSTARYVSDTRSIRDTIRYTYDTRHNLKTTRSRNGLGEYVEKVNIYNYDIPPVAYETALTKIASDDMDRVVASETWNNGTNAGTRNSASQLLNASVFRYTVTNNIVLNKVAFATYLDQPLSYTTYMGGQTSASQQILNAYNNPAAIPDYLHEVTDIQSFNEIGDAMETYLPEEEVYKSVIWDTIIGKKTAEVVNARHTEIVYAGFDNGSGVEHNLQLTYGRISELINGVMSVPSVGFGIPVTQPLTGKGVYVLKGNAGGAKELYCNSLQSGKLYRATFWASQNAVPQFGIEGGTQFTLNEIAQKGEYKQYEVLFTPTAANQKIGFHSSSDYIALDEIRIHPADAVMENYRYTPLFGTSVSTDALGRMTFYEYDGLGRLVLTRDQDGNILKKTTYGVQALPNQ